MTSSMNMNEIYKGRYEEKQLIRRENHVRKGRDNINVRHQYSPIIDRSI